jgi:hypothetical protein
MVKSKKSMTVAAPVAVILKVKKPTNRTTRVITKRSTDSYIKKWARVTHGARLPPGQVEIFGNSYEHLVRTIAESISASLKGKKRKTATLKDARYAVLGMTNNPDFQRALLSNETAALESYRKSL